MIKNYKNYIIIILILIIITISGILYYTYAKYITSISSDTEISVARWNITVNNENITTGSNFSNIITPVFPGNNNIAPDVIAPTAEGYFDIILDVSNTDVSLRYTITTSPNQDSAVSDLIISGYSVNNGERQDPIGTFVIEDTIPYDSQNKQQTIRIFLKWNDDANNGAIMDNDDDTNATSNTNNKAKINVNFNIIQLAAT